MTGHIYRVFVVIDDTNFVGLSAAEKTQHALDKTDYETNHQSFVQKITSIVVAGTTLFIDVNYADFKALIDGTIITWSDVDEMSRGNRYILHLLSESAL